MWCPEEKSNILFPIAGHDFIDSLPDLSMSQRNYIETLLFDYWKYVCLGKSLKSVFLFRVVP